MAASNEQEGIPISNDNHQGLGSRIHALFAADGGVELDLPDRRDLPADQQRRAQIAELFLHGDWGVELESFEADQENDRQKEAQDR
jgi:hypothetical protein